MSAPKPQEADWFLIAYAVFMVSAFGFFITVTVKGCNSSIKRDQQHREAEAAFEASCAKRGGIIVPTGYRGDVLICVPSKQILGRFDR